MNTIDVKVGEIYRCTSNFSPLIVDCEVKEILTNNHQRDAYGFSCRIVKIIRQSLSHPAKIGQNIFWTAQNLSPIFEPLDILKKML